MSVLDCRGLACPEPVVRTKEALAHLEEGELIVMVNNAVSCNNVERFARGQGCSVEIKESGEAFKLHIRKVRGQDKQASFSPDRKTEKIVVYINSDHLGIGDDALGTGLMRVFLKTLLDLTGKPQRLILIHSGVRLASEDSEVLESLRALSDQGVEILSCGTCLDFYHLKERLRVGIISNMYDIVQSLLEADRIIRP